ncbi:hypothetical protein AB4K20DRAFT_1970666 [Rhizopus microsporus]
MIPNDNFFRLIDFDRFYFGHENKMHLWNTVFNIGKVDTGVLANPATSHLAYSTKIDGHMISILFEKTSVEFITQAKNDLIRQKRNIGFANRTKGLYSLYKEPTGITANDRIIGIDPGVRDIIYAIDCDADELQKELASRLSSDIQASYAQLKTRNTYTNQEHKGYAYSNRSMAEDHVARVVLGQTKVDEAFKLAHCSSKSTRRKKRKRFRRQHQDELRGNEDTRRAIVAYGDASIRGTYRGNTPVPVKQVQRAIAQKAIVFTVDEFRTSVTCCHCQRRMNNVTSELNICDHNKKKHRINSVENRSRRKCLDEEGHIFHWSSRCPESRVVRQNNIIYPLKLCNQCPVNGNNDLYWQRDVNAATNIKSVLIECIRSNFNIRSRPVALSRSQQDQGN